jgi:Holliday junction resolvase
MERASSARGRCVAVSGKARNMSARGSSRERQVVRLLESEGWVCFRAPGSFGVADVVACRRWPFAALTKEGLTDAYCAEVMLVEVKTTARNPWNDFGPAKRRTLLEAAARAGASAWVYWWPMGGELERIPSSHSQWPAS